MIIECACGCGKVFSELDKYNRPRKYIRGHCFRGKPLNEARKRKISISHMGNKNGMWKGDNVGYNGIHKWINSHLVKPELCEICKSVPPYDAANISGDYLRDLTDWQWLCRKCHMDSDERKLNLKQYRNCGRRV